MCARYKAQLMMQLAILQWQCRVENPELLSAQRHQFLEL